jgi:hypothetical protein
MKKRIPSGAGTLILVVAACVIFLVFLQVISGSGRDAEIERFISAGRPDGPGATPDSPPPGVDRRKGSPNMPGGRPFTGTEVPGQ